MRRGGAKPIGFAPLTHPPSIPTAVPLRDSAIGLAGLLTGTSDGHAVRALLEVITVEGELKLVALGRRLDGAGSWTFAADLPWDEILEKGTWVPQNTREANPFHGRMDDVMLLDSVPTPEQIAAQYALFAAAPTEPPTPPACAPEGTVITDVMAERHWAPRTPDKWVFPGRPALGSIDLSAEVRIDEKASVNNREVILVFGWKSDTEYYYAHLSKDNTIYPHNGIFKVNGADRERIDDQWDGATGAPPAITDEDWHDVRVVRCADTGEVAVYLDGIDAPLLTATDTTFSEGRVGFGSFDNFGRLRALTVTTERSDTTAPTATVKTDPGMTVGRGGVYSVVSFKLFDEGRIDALSLNGVEKDLTDDVWSDLNGVKPGVFGAVEGVNTLIVRDVAGNETTVRFTLDATPPIVTVKTGAGTVGADGVYAKVSFKLYDLGRIDRLTLNGTAKDLTDNVWSDLNDVVPGSFGATLGENVLTVIDVAGNTTEVRFTLVA